MNKFSYINIALAFALTFSAFAGSPSAALAADHNAHTSGHTQGQGHAAVENSQIYTATGIVNSVDSAAHKVTLTHDPVPALGWPTMTMGFVFEDPSLLEGLKANDKVRFDFRNQGNTSTILDIEIIN